MRRQVENPELAKELQDTYVVFKREPFSDYIDVHYADGSSEIVESNRLYSFFKRNFSLDIEEDDSRKTRVVDMVFNFGLVVYYPTIHEFDVL